MSDQAEMSFAALQQPESTLEAVEFVRANVSAGRGMILSGGTYAPIVDSNDDKRILLSAARLNRVLEHEQQDLTVTVEAGCPLAVLEAAVRQHNQRLPIEVPDPERWTVGGIVAARAEGFLRMAFGSVRDQILGMQVITTSGEETHTGGRVVKNVTGYDLAKLYCGSHGSLGFFTSITFRLRALAPATRTIALGRDDAATAFALALDLRNLVGRVTGLVVVGGRVNPVHNTPWMVLIRIEGHPETLDKIVGEISLRHGENSQVPDNKADDLWRHLHSSGIHQALCVRIDLAVSQIQGAVERLQRSAEDPDAGVVADMGSGRIEFHLTRILRDVDTTCGELVLGRLAVDYGARISLPYQPDDLRERFNRFGTPPRAELELLRRVKHAIDPTGLFAQGRFYREFK